jgi:hypothetical protein
VTKNTPVAAAKSELELFVLASCDTGFVGALLDEQLMDTETRKIDKNVTAIPCIVIAV